MRSAALALVLVGCGAAPIAPTHVAPAPPIARPVAQSVLFPERPSLDALAPARPSFFKQESWTEMTSGVAQHCHEWAFDAAEEASLRAEANQTLAELGLAARFGELIREDGVSGSLSTIDTDALGELREVVKLVVCTETEPVDRARAFIAPLAARSRATVGGGDAFAPLVADLAWERRYGDGRRRYGVRWSGDQSALRVWMLGHGYRDESTRDTSILVRGPERVRFTGVIWWQSDATR